MTTRMLCFSVTTLTCSKREARKRKQSNAPDQINRTRYEIAARFQSPFVFKGRLGRSTRPVTANPVSWDLAPRGSATCP